MSKRTTPARWGSDGAVLASRRAISVALRRNPELISRHCTPVACDVRTRALLYDVDDAEQILAAVLRWSSKRLKTSDSCKSA